MPCIEVGTRAFHRRTADRRCGRPFVRARPSKKGTKVRRRSLPEDRLTRGLIWDLGLGLAAAIYLDLVLFQGVEIPLFGFVWIAVAGTRIVDLHRSS